MGDNTPPWESADDLEELKESSSRQLFGLDSDEPVDRRHIQRRLADHFEALQQHGGEARPHIRFPLNEEAFADALANALDAETTHLEHDDRLVVVDPDLERGTISLSITVRQYVEDGLSEASPTDSRGDGVDDVQAIVDEYYADGAPHLQKSPRNHAVSRLYVTILRDMSTACRRAVETMRRTVDETDGLVWGREPVLHDLDGSYGFSGTIYYRPTEA